MEHSRMEKRLKKAVELADSIGYDTISVRLAKELEAYNADTYRIAVVGEFKSGKSTLINSVFLKENVLFTDIMEATAVPTEINYGRDRMLEIVPYETASETQKNPFEDDRTDSLERISGEGEPVRIINPTGKDIKRHTAAETPEERALLARKNARVRLFWPSANLGGLTLFDTPGINSINEAVISTTYRIIPETDLVLFVTNARQLSGIELEFLSSRVFSEGITRAFTVVTYDPRMGVLTEEQKDDLINSVHGQLAHIGRENVPVEMIELFGIDTRKATTATRSFRERINGFEAEEAPEKKKNLDSVVDDVIGNLLGRENEGKTAYEEPEEVVPETTGIPSLEDKLITFIRDNVRPGRIEKARQVLIVQLQLAVVRCTTELAALNKSEKKRLQLLQEIKTKEAQMHKKYEDLSLSFQKELHWIESRFRDDIIRGMNGVLNTYISGFDACESLDELQTRLNAAENLIKKDIEELFLFHTQRAGEEIRHLTEKYSIKNQVAFNPWQHEISRELEIEGGVLSRIPPISIFALDIGIAVFLGPLSRLAYIAMLLLVDEIPFVKRILPTAIAGNLLKHNLKKSLKKQFQAMEAQLPQQIDRSFKSVGEKFVAEWRAYTEEQLSTVRKGVEKSVEHPVDSQYRQKLEGVKDQMESMLAEIL